MLDVHGRLNVPTAIAMCRALAPFDLTWIEEPTPPESIDALAEVRAASPVPIAAGERWYEPGRFLEALSKKAVDVLQPDVSHAGGLGETKRVAHLAHPHSDPGGAAQSGRAGDERHDAAHLGGDPELHACSRRCRSTCPGARSWCARRWCFEDGAILAPTAPGLGVELIEEACARFPYAALRRAAVRRHDEHQRRGRRGDADRAGVTGARVAAPAGASPRVRAGALRGEYFRQEDGAGSAPEGCRPRWGDVDIGGLRGIVKKRTGTVHI